MPIIKKFQKSMCEQTIQSLFLLPTLNTTASTFRPEHEDLYQGDEGGSAINSKTALILAVRNFLQDESKTCVSPPTNNKEKKGSQSLHFLPSNHIPSGTRLNTSRKAESEGDDVCAGLQGTYRVVSVKSKCCVEYNKVF